MENNDAIDKLSYENTRRLMERRESISKEFRSLIINGILENEKEAVKLCNKQLYEMAEQGGVSLWDLCLNLVPEMVYPDDSDDTYTIVFKPLPLEFEKGPGYWKSKYYALKRRMQELIDEKEEKQ